MNNLYIPAGELSNADYHASEGVSKSGLDLINDTPAHFYERYLKPDRVPLPPTPALIFGSAFHTILESESLFLEEYCEGITADKRTKEGKNKHAEFMELADGKTILTPDEWNRVHRMRDKLMSRVSMRTLLEGGVEAEPSFYWDQFANSTFSTARARCRPDLIAKSRDFVLDFKTTVSAKREDFEKSCANFRYHVQAAWYLTGCSAVTASPINTFFFVAVEKEAPYAVQIFEAPLEFVRRGHESMQRNFDTYAQCMKNYEAVLETCSTGSKSLETSKIECAALAQCWPDYPDEITTLNLPKWTPV